MGSHLMDPAWRKEHNFPPLHVCPYLGCGRRFILPRSLLSHMSWHEKPCRTICVSKEKIQGGNIVD